MYVSKNIDVKNTYNYVKIESWLSPKRIDIRVLFGNFVSCFLFVFLYFVIKNKHHRDAFSFQRLREFVFNISVLYID